MRRVKEGCVLSGYKVTFPIINDTITNEKPAKDERQATNNICFYWCILIGILGHQRESHDKGSGIS